MKQVASYPQEALATALRTAAETTDMADPTTVGREEHLQWSAAILATLDGWTLIENKRLVLEVARVEVRDTEIARLRAALEWIASGEYSLPAEDIARAGLAMEDSLMSAHDITDPNAPLGWQCGDPGCREHGIAQFEARQMKAAIERLRNALDDVWAYSRSPITMYCYYCGARPEQAHNEGCAASIAGRALGKKPSA